MIQKKEKEKVNFFTACGIYNGYAAIIFFCGTDSGADCRTDEKSEQQQYETLFFREIDRLFILLLLQSAQFLL